MGTHSLSPLSMPVLPPPWPIKLTDVHHHDKSYTCLQLLQPLHATTAPASDAFQIHFFFVYRKSTTQQMSWKHSSSFREKRSPLKGPVFLSKKFWETFWSVEDEELITFHIIFVVWNNSFDITFSMEKIILLLLTLIQSFLPKVSISSAFLCYLSIPVPFFGVWSTSLHFFQSHDSGTLDGHLMGRHETVFENAADLIRPTLLFPGTEKVLWGAFPCTPLVTDGKQCCARISMVHLFGPFNLILLFECFCLNIFPSRICHSLETF